MKNHIPSLFHEKVAFLILCRQPSIFLQMFYLFINFYYQQSWSSCCVVGAEPRNASVTKNFTTLVTTYHVESCNKSCKVFCGTFSAVGVNCPHWHFKKIWIWFRNMKIWTKFSKLPTLVEVKQKHVFINSNLSPHNYIVTINLKKEEEKS